MELAEWLRDKPLDMFHVLGPPGKIVSERKYRLIAAACCRETCKIFGDLNSAVAVNAPKVVAATEDYADGKIPLCDLERAFYPFLGLRHFEDDFFTQVIETGNASAYDAAYQWLYRAGASRAVRYANVLREMCGYPFQGDLYLSDDGRLLELFSTSTFPAIRGVGFKSFTSSLYRPVAWLSSISLSIARGIYEDRDFDSLPILADSLEESGCTSETLLRHLRGEERCFAGISAYPESGCLSVAPLQAGEGWGVWKSDGVSSNYLHIASHKRTAKKWAEAHFDIRGWNDRSDGSGKWKRAYAIPGKAKFGWRSTTLPHSRGCWALDLILGNR